jgi:uncharacterized damage-inducible protein DinB
MSRTWRKGAVGALMDETERAAEELRRTVEALPEELFDRVLDPDTDDPDCRSVGSILAHVVRAGYGYAHYLRSHWGLPERRPPAPATTRDEALDHLRGMVGLTAETLDGRWEMSDEEAEAVRIESRWGVVYDLEQLLEHGIVHLLRHRRQIERLTATAGP